MDILQLINAALHVVLASFFAMLPGMSVWLGVLAVFLLVRRISHGTPFGPPRADMQRD